MPIHSNVDKVFKEVVEEMTGGIKGTDLFGPCNDPNCVSCVAEKARREDAKQAENGFTKSPTHDGNGTVN